MVTAGLMWPPLMCAMIQTIVATLRPNASEILTTSVGSFGSNLAHEPHATRTRNSVPTNSARTACQNLTDFTSRSLDDDIVSAHSAVIAKVFNRFFRASGTVCQYLPVILIQLLSGAFGRSQMHKNSPHCMKNVKNFSGETPLNPHY